ncbi:MAG: hypothetical protein J6W16_06955 [Methanobrevibacter sp.]|nr:hypothetical protein [Methanobrevibacter sp.]MBP5785303.1 hypothetical protein [Methanobrevibacter sp.]
MIQLYHGDCTNLIKSLPDKSVDLVVTDPPYNFGAKGGGIVNKRNYVKELDLLNCCDFKPIPFLNLIKPKMKHIYIYIFCNKTLVADYITWAKENKCSFDILVMCKSNPIPAFNNHYMSDLEYIIVIREPGTYFSKEKNIELYRKWFMTNCKKGLHPAEKPLELIKKFITVGSNKGDLIFDPFLGSGTTGVAAKELERNFIGCEISDDYFNLCKERIRESEIIKIDDIKFEKKEFLQGELF